MSNRVKEQSDKELMQACSSDSGVFTIVFERYFHRLYRYTLHYVREEEIAEELAMDVMVRLWQKRHAIRAEPYLTPYLYRFIKNAIYDHWKKKALETVSFVPIFTRWHNAINDGGLCIAR